MINGIIGKARIMALDGIERARATRHVLDVERVTRLEKAIAEAGTPLDELMRRAGAACAHQVEAGVPDPALVVILCGSGNNGGDGWVCARLLAQAGWPVTLVTPLAADGLKAWPASKEAKTTCDAIVRDRLPIKLLIDPDPTTLSTELACAAAIVDGMLGTGFTGNMVREPYATWIELANRRRTKDSAKAKDVPFALSIDAPSGLSAQTGAVAKPCFQADETLTMLALKPGLLKASAKPYTGCVELAELINEREWPKGALGEDI